jgi:hypothetical protein
MVTYIKNGMTLPFGVGQGLVNQAISKLAVDGSITAKAYFVKVLKYCTYLTITIFPPFLFFTSGKFPAHSHSHSYPKLPFPIDMQLHVIRARLKVSFVTSLGKKGSFSDYCLIARLRTEESLSRRDSLGKRPAPVLHRVQCGSEDILMEDAVVRAIEWRALGSIFTLAGIQADINRTEESMDIEHEYIK